jgi:hypothetical protein
MDGAAQLFLVLTHARSPILVVAPLAAAVAPDAVAYRYAWCDQPSVERPLPCSSVRRNSNPSSWCRYRSGNCRKRAVVLVLP